MLCNPNTLAHSAFVTPSVFDFANSITASLSRFNPITAFSWIPEGIFKLSHLNGLSDDDPQILDLDTMYEDLRQFSFRVHVQAIRGAELNQDTYTESLIEVDPDIHDYLTQYFGRLHRNHDKDATLIENDPLLQDETFACVGIHEQLREGGYF